MIYQIRTTIKELEDIAKCYNLASLLNSVKILFYEHRGADQGVITKVTLDPDPTNAEVIIATIYKDET